MNPYLFEDVRQKGDPKGDAEVDKTGEDEEDVFRVGDLEKVVQNHSVPDIGNAIHGDETRQP